MPDKSNTSLARHGRQKRDFLPNEKGTTDFAAFPFFLLDKPGTAKAVTHDQSDFKTVPTRRISTLPA